MRGTKEIDNMVLNTSRRRFLHTHRCFHAITV
jgi:hypothetical protein